MVRCYLVGCGFSSDIQSTERGNKVTRITVEFTAEDDEGAHE